MSERATCWSVTINNPTKSDDENISMAQQRSGWAVYGQEEMGENGTPHYQLMVTTPQVRFSAVKKAFPRAHIEVARDRKALTAYVKKEDTRVASLQTDNKYPSLQTLWDMFAEFVNNKKYRNLVDTSPERRLEIFDDFIRDAIDKGFMVETMGVNPQMRSSVKQYGENIVLRSLRRQTDRQTAENNVEVISIPEYNAEQSDERWEVRSNATSSSSEHEGEEEGDGGSDSSSSQESRRRPTRR